MGAMTSWIDKRSYPEHRDNWDDWLFRDRILAQIRPGSVVLDLGAGAGIVEQIAEMFDVVLSECSRTSG